MSVYRGDFSKCEEKDYQLFAKKGFQAIVGPVDEIEKSSGMHDLARFTPRSSL